jgi:hypothetical protein
MAIRKCKTCGFAYWLPRILCWRGNGTISWKQASDTKLALIESDLLNEVFSDLEEKLGHSIMHIVFEAQKNAVAAGLTSQFDQFPASLGRIGPNKRLVTRFFCRFSIWLGTAYAEVVSYKPGVLGEALFRNPYNPELMAAVTLGGFEALELRPFKHQWRKEGEDDILVITPAEKQSKVSERTRLYATETKPGNQVPPLCRSCGAPQGLSCLEWHPEEGKIIDTHKDIRVSFLDAFTPGIVFRELERELGSEIKPLILDASKEFYLRHLADSEVSSRDYFGQGLAYLQLWGQGIVTDIRHEGESFKISIDNPYDSYLIAGKLAALYERAEGKSARVEWESPGASEATFTVTPVRAEAAV